MTGVVVTADYEHIEQMLAEGLRSADLLEIGACGHSPRHSLEKGLRSSLPCLAVVNQGKCCGMFGVVPDSRYEGSGAIWFLGTDRILEMKTQFLRESKEWLTEITKNYRAVSNFIHEDNALHIKWLKWLGFAFFRKVGHFIEFGRLV